LALRCIFLSAPSRRVVLVLASRFAEFTYLLLLILLAFLSAAHLVFQQFFGYKEFEVFTWRCDAFSFCTFQAGCSCFQVAEVSHASLRILLNFIVLLAGLRFGVILIWRLPCTLCFSTWFEALVSMLMSLSIGCPCGCFRCRPCRCHPICLPAYWVRGGAMCDVSV
jgi:hypothetical protein